MAIYDKYGGLAANKSQSFIVFETKDKYDTWVHSLSTLQDEMLFIVIKKYPTETSSGPTIQIRGEEFPLEAKLGYLPDFDGTHGYSKGEVFRYRTGIYRANTKIEPGSAPSIGNADMIINLRTMILDFAPGEYKKGEVILHEGSLYRVKSDDSYISDFDMAYFEKIGGGGSAGTTKISDFVANKNYEKDEPIIHLGALYRAKRSLTSATFIAADWELISGGEAQTLFENYKPNHSYLANEAIYHEGVLYRARIAFISSTDFNVDNWDTVSSFTSVIREFDGSFPYHKGEIMLYNALPYYATRDVMGIGEFDPIDWALLPSGNFIAPGFVPNKKYAANEIIKYNNALYAAKSNFVSTTTFVDANWQSLGGGGGTPSITKISDFVVNKTYEKDEPIVEMGSLYRAKYQMRAPAFRAEDWELIVGGEVQTLFQGYKPNYSYVANEVIYHKDCLFRAIADFVSPANFSPYDWEVIIAYSTVIKEFDGTFPYGIGEVVFYNGLPYYSIERSMGNDYFDPANWRLLPSGNFIAPAFVPEKKYVANEIIKHNGGLYAAKADFTATTDFVEINWESLSGGGGDIEGRPRVYDYAIFTDYKAQALCMEKGNLYRAKADFSSGMTFDPDEWDIVAANTIIPEFTPNTSFLKDQVIQYNKILYSAIRDFRSYAAFDPNDWKALGGGGGDSSMSIKAFEPSKAYKANDIIQHDKGIYRAYANFTSGANFVLSNWEAIGNKIFEYNGTTAYPQSSLVVNNGAVYLTKQHTPPGQDPTDPEFFYEFSKAVDGFPKVYDFNTMTPYKMWNLCTYNGNLYRSRSDFTSTTDFDPNQWEMIGNNSTRIPRFAQNTRYLKDDLCINNNQIYRAKAEFYSATIFDPADWDQLSASAENTIIPEFRPLTQYSQNQMIRDPKTNLTWVALRDFLSEAKFSEADWVPAVPKIGAVLDFVDNTWYAYGQLVRHNGVVYRHTQDATETPFEWHNWETFTGQVSEFDWSAYYIKGTLVHHNGKLYLNQKDCDGEDIDDSNYFKPIDISKVNNFSSNNMYYENEVIFHEGKLYRSKVEFSPEATFDESNWELIGGGGGGSAVLDFAPNTKYSKGMLCTVEGKLYRAKVDFTSAATFVLTNWDLVGGGIFLYNMDTDYLAGSLVIDKGSIYYVKIKTPAGTPVSNTVYYSKLGGGAEFTEISEYNSAIAYKQGAVCTSNRQLIRATKDVDPSAPMPLADWESISPSIVKEYQPSIWYAKGEIIVQDGVLHSAKRNFLSSAVFTDSEWNSIPGKGVTHDFALNIKYAKGTLCTRNGNLYRAKLDFTSAVDFVPTQWDLISDIPEMTMAEWNAIAANKKPNYACITDSPYDSTY